MMAPQTPAATRLSPPRPTRPYDQGVLHLSTPSVARAAGPVPPGWRTHEAAPGGRRLLAVVVIAALATSGAPTPSGARERRPRHPPATATVPTRRRAGRRPATPPD